MKIEQECLRPEKHHQIDDSDDFNFEFEDEEDIYEAGLPSTEDRHIVNQVSNYKLMSKNFPSNLNF